MSHEITMTNGAAEMAYVGATPWHGLGNELAAGASIEEWQVAAGMAWKIKRSFVRYATSLDATPETLMKMDDKHGICFVPIRKPDSESCQTISRLFNRPPCWNSFAT